MMHASGPRPDQVAVQTSLAAIFVSLELSRSTWLITSLVPGGGDKMSKHLVRSGDVAELMRVGAKMPLPGLSGAAAERYGATPSSAGCPMPYRFNEPRRHKIPRARYRVQNWPEYDRALQRRGT